MTALADQPPAVSQHLKALQEAGLVTARPADTARYYRIRREGLAELRTYLDGFWDEVLAAYAQEVNKTMGCAPGRSACRDSGSPEVRISAISSGVFTTSGGSCLGHTHARSVQLLLHDLIE